MRRAVMLVAVLAIVAWACRGGDDGAAGSTVVATAPGGEPIVIRTRVVIAAVEGADVPATGEVLEGSTLGDAPFCVGGTIEDRHADDDPGMAPYGLLARTITCPDGTVSIGFTPGQTSGVPQTGTWTFVSGTGTFEGLRGSGEMETTYDPSDGSLARETLTGTVTRSASRLRPTPLGHPHRSWLSRAVRRPGQSAADRVHMSPG
jgi:hypothetical protein